MRICVHLVGRTAASSAKLCAPIQALNLNLWGGLQGIKMGDLQLTIMAFSSAGLFFVISNAKPVAHLSPQRPHATIFCAYTFLSILGQFAMHTFFLVFCYNSALAIMPKVRTCHIAVVLLTLWSCLAANPSTACMQYH